MGLGIYQNLCPAFSLIPRRMSHTTQKTSKFKLWKNALSSFIVSLEHRRHSVWKMLKSLSHYKLGPHSSDVWRGWKPREVAPRASEQGSWVKKPLKKLRYLFSNNLLREAGFIREPVARSLLDCCMSVWCLHYKLPLHDSPCFYILRKALQRPLRFSFSSVN